ncbi:CsbD family protein [Camelimonas lactis]|uniref:Uncharacterized protein YjbJ (UPF0337 family) n=1 Tax=Camelimonas lactis TaxID=659006 RepID=A0A4R2GQY0_9HYPH|nr:CsbD family protein [Camelimonas lactis]TCO12394.1 uncharacterized protein YjbJ (UPF0337 family) [Camelimonas lactis]
MDTDRIKGAGNEALGKARQFVGDLTNDGKLQASGVVDEATGAAQRAFGQAKDAARDGAAAVTRQTRSNPLGTLLAVGAAGFVLGMMCRR